MCVLRVYFLRFLDGQYYDGAVKAKEEAQQQYTGAVSRGESAGLVRWMFRFFFFFFVICFEFFFSLSVADELKPVIFKKNLLISPSAGFSPFNYTKIHYIPECSSVLSKPL